MHLGANVTEFLRTLPTQPSLLGLGEPTHGEEEFPRLRNEIFQHLVDHEGYRPIALESDCLAALIADRYIATREGTLGDALSKGFSHGFGAYAANRELLEWMRDYNTGKPATDRLRFYGFDAPLEIASAPSPGPALDTAHGYLAAHLDQAKLPCTVDEIHQLAGDDTRWSDPASVLDATKSVGRSADANRLRIIADDLVTQLLTHSPHLVAVTSYAEWWQARLHARSAAGLLRYHAVLADVDAGSTRIENGSALRDTLMAENLVAITEYEHQRGPTLVFAGSSHLQRDKSTMRIPEGWRELAGHVIEWWSGCAIAATQLGQQRYAFLAMERGPDGTIYLDKVRGSQVRSRARSDDWS